MHTFFGLRFLTENNQRTYVKNGAKFFPLVTAGMTGVMTARCPALLLHPDGRAAPPDHRATQG